MDDLDPPVTFAKVVLQECGQESCVHEICNLAHVVIDYDNQLKVVARERLEAESKLDAVQRTFGKRFCVCNCYGCSKQMDCCHGCTEAQDIVKSMLGSALDNAVKTLDGVIKIAKNEIEMLKGALDEACGYAEEALGVPKYNSASNVLAIPPGYWTGPPVSFARYNEAKARLLQLRNLNDDRYRRAERVKRYGK